MHPQVNEVWGDPAKPETWRLVRHIDTGGYITYLSWGHTGGGITPESWEHNRKLGLVRIHAVEDTVDTLLAEVERLTAELAAAQAKIERVNVMEASNPPAPLLTVRQVAERLSLSSTAVYALCDSGELPAFKIGAGKRKRYRIEPVSVEAYLERSKVRPVVEVARPARAGRVAPGGFVMLRAAGFRG